MNKVLALVFAFFLISSLKAQTFTQTNNGNATTCAGTFVDAGGANGNYADGDTTVYTICPDVNTQLKVVFSQLALGPGDQLEVFYGTAPVGTAAATLNSTFTPPISLISSFTVDTTGCFTFRFTSDANVNDSGWVAAISCVAPCQQVVADIYNTIPDTIQTGFADICLNDTVSFFGTATFPENNTYYSQTIASSTFDWMYLGGDTFASGQSAVVPFDSIAGYTVQLVVTDSNGCLSNNVMEIPVRVATDPDFTGTQPETPSICFGESIDLYGVVTPTNWTNADPSNVAGTTYLPDGSGASYTSTLTFNNFQNGATLNNIGQFQQFWMNMEHSYLGDLHIVLSCPNGNSAIIKDFANGGGNTFLGEACDNTTLTPGIGYNYFFPSTGAVNNSLGVEGAGACAICIPYNDPCSLFGNPQDVLPSATYATVQPLTNLVGCPLNGTWSLSITDNLLIDNGFIFAWGLDFDPSLYPPNIFSYTPGIDSVYWNITPDVIANNGDTITVKPNYFDSTYSYTFTAIDSFGCSHDTTVDFYVKSPCEPSCLVSNTTSTGMYQAACPGDSSGYVWVKPDVTAAPGPFDVYWVDNNNDTIGMNISFMGADTLFNIPDGLYTARVISNYGCEVVRNRLVTAVPPMVLSSSAVNGISCAGAFCDGSATVNAVLGTSPYTYLWENGLQTQTGGQLCGGQNLVQVTDARGCIDTLAINVPTPDSISVITVGDTLICQSNSTPIGVIANGGTPPYQYSWNYGLNPVPNPLVGPYTTTQYSVSVTDANNCPFASDVVLVKVRNPLTSFTAPLDTVCSYDVSTLAVFVQGGDSTYTYNWSNGAGTDSAVQVSPNVPTLYTVTVNDGCGTPSIVDSVFVQVGGYGPLTVKVVNDTICRGEVAYLSAQGVGGDGQYTYTWSTFGEGQLHAVTPDQTEHYFVTVRDNCNTPVGVGVKTIAIGNWDNLSYYVEEDTLCAPGPFKMKFNSMPPGVQLDMSFGESTNSVVSPYDTFNVDLLKFGCHDVRIRVKTVHGCVNDKVLPCGIYVKPVTLPDFTYSAVNPEIQEPAVQFESLTTNMRKYTWTIDGKEVNANIGFYHTFADTGLHPVKLGIVNLDGCYSEVTKDVLVRLESTVFVPNSFSPNNDGLNDLFGIVGEGVEDNFKMEIYDRWGKLIFSTVNPKEYWDGNYKGSGEKVTPGSYIYSISYTGRNGKVIQKTGDVNVIR